MTILLNSWPSFDKQDISKVSDILSSGNVNYWTGQECKLFEKEFSSFVGVDSSIACSNGSLSLSLAYLAIGLGNGDEFITSPRTFLATASSGVLLGAKPIFADVDIDSGSITASTIEPLITKKTKAIVVVHVGGWPADMPSICNLADSYKIPVIEDCAQAHGAYVNNRSVGSYGQISSWSFCQDKIISTGGEGGMVCTSNSKFYELMWSFKDHGKNRQTISSKPSSPGFRWVHDTFGSNFRMTELQSGLGRLQLQRLPMWNALRRRNALIIADALADIPCIHVPLPPQHLTHAWYKFYAFVNPQYLASGWSRNRILHEITQLGFPAYTGSCSEIYLEKCFYERGFAPPTRLPIARQLGETSLMFLVHPTITLEQIKSYSDVIRSVILRASL